MFLTQTTSEIQPERHYGCDGGELARPLAGAAEYCVERSLGPENPDILRASVPIATRSLPSGTTAVT